MNTLNEQNERNTLNQNVLNKQTFRCMLMVALMSNNLLFANIALPADSDLNAEQTCSIEKNLLAAGQGSTKKIARRNALFKLNSKWQNMMPNAPAIEMDDDRLSFSCSKKLIWSCLATLTTSTTPTSSNALQNCQQNAKLSVNAAAANSVSSRSSAKTTASIEQLEINRTTRNKLRNSSTN